jgi:hypothetical protein
MKRAAATKVGASLAARKLMRELRSKPGMPVWRMDNEGRSVSLMITRAECEAIGVDEGGSTQTAHDGNQIRSSRSSLRKADGLESSPIPQLSNVTSPRAGSKQALVAEMLGARWDDDRSVAGGHGVRVLHPIRLRRSPRTCSLARTLFAGSTRRRAACLQRPPVCFDR